MTKQDFYWLVDEFKPRAMSHFGKWHIDGCAESLICDGYLVTRYEKDTLFMFKKNHLRHKIDYTVCADKAKPYLRRLETITMREQYSLEIDLLEQFVCNTINKSLLKSHIINNNFISFYIHHWYCRYYFDDSNLIEKGYALEAPKGMYK